MLNAINYDKTYIFSLLKRSFHGKSLTYELFRNLSLFATVTARTKWNQSKLSQNVLKIEVML